MLGLGVFGFVDVTLESMETAGPRPRAAALSCAIVLAADEPLFKPGSAGPPRLRLGGVLFFKVFGDFNEILKFSDVWRPFAKGKSGPCCWQTAPEKSNQLLMVLCETVYQCHSLLDCCADCGICHLARLCMALFSCGDVCGGPALKPAGLP